MRGHSYPRVVIGDLVSRVATWNPLRSAPDAEFDYIDIASIDRESKTITQATRLKTQDAPSRARQLVKAKDVLVSTVRPNLNAVAAVPDNLDAATASTGYCILRPIPDRLDHRYLFHWVRTPEFIGEMTRLSTGASYPAVSDRIVCDSTIPLPPVSEQKRIAAILDQADAVRHKRRQAGQATAALIPSAFYEIFGDPGANPKGWPIVEMGEVVSTSQYGTSSSLEVDRRAYPVLRMNNITYSGEWVLNDLKWLDFTDEELPKYTVRRGDLLFNRTNSPDLVGKTGVWTSDEVYAFAGYLIRFRFDEKRALPDFVSAYLNSTYGKSLLFKSAIPSNNMSNISASTFRRLPLMLPHLRLQQKFAECSTHVRTSLGRQRCAADESDSLFHSITQRAFRGEL